MGGTCNLSHLYQHKWKGENEWVEAPSTTQKTKTQERTKVYFFQNSKKIDHVWEDCSRKTRDKDRIINAENKERTRPLSRNVKQESNNTVKTCLQWRWKRRLSGHMLRKKYKKLTRDELENPVPWSDCWRKASHDVITLVSRTDCKGHLEDSTCKKSQETAHPHKDRQCWGRQLAYLDIKVHYKACD